MKYYLITKEEYLANHSNCEHAPAYTADGSKCILEVEDTHPVLNYIQVFSTANEVNEFRFSSTTSESSNWLTEDDMI